MLCLYIRRPQCRPEIRQTIWLRMPGMQGRSLTGELRHLVRGAPMRRGARMTRALYSTPETERAKTPEAAMAEAAIMASDSLWQAIRAEAQCAAASDPVSASSLAGAILEHDDFSAGLADLIGRRLGNNATEQTRFTAFSRDAFRGSPELIEVASCDLQAIVRSDPASPTCCRRFCITRATSRCKPGASRTGCGVMIIATPRCCFRTRRRTSCRSAFIRPAASARPCISTTPPAL